MEKLEIYKNVEAIDQKSQRLPEVCTVLQSLYDKLNTNSLSVSFETIEDFTRRFLQDANQNRQRRQGNHNPEKVVTDFIKNVTFDSNPNGLNTIGLKISREKTLELIEIDNEDINEVLNMIGSLTIDDFELIKYISFDTENSTIEPVTDYAAIIEADNTIFADTDKQITIATALLKLRDALAEYSETCKRFTRPEDIDGLIITPTGYKLDVQRIKNYL